MVTGKIYFTQIIIVSFRKLWIFLDTRINKCIVKFLHKIAIKFEMVLNIIEYFHIKDFMLSFIIRKI